MYDYLVFPPVAIVDVYDKHNEPPPDWAIKRNCLLVVQDLKDPSESSAYGRCTNHV